MFKSVQTTLFDKTPIQSIWLAPFLVATSQTTHVNQR